MKHREIRFRGTPVMASITDPQAQVDGDAGVIKGVSAIQNVEALGHGMTCDATTVQQVVDAINAAPMGIGSRFTHPGMCDDGSAKMIGRVTNASVGGQGNLPGELKARCDLHLADYAAKSPDGNLRDYVIARAMEDPASFGLSIAALINPVWRLDDGSEIDAWDDNGDQIPKPANAVGDDLPLARIVKLKYVDVVGDPAANRDGLFSAGSVLAATTFHEIDAWLSARGISRERAQAFVARYFAAKKGGTSHKAMGNPAPATPEKGNSMTPEQLKQLKAKHPDHAGLIVDMFADGKGVAEIEAAIVDATKDAERAKVASQLATATAKLGELADKVEKLSADHKAALTAKDDQIAKLSADLAKAKKVADLGTKAPEHIGGLETDEEGDALSDAALEKRWGGDPELRKRFMGDKEAFIALARNDAAMDAAMSGKGKTTITRIDPGVFRRGDKE